MYLAQFAGKSVLQIVKELLDAGQPDTRQVPETHLLHVKHEYETGMRTQLVQARIDRHEERFDRLVEVIVARFGI